MLRKSAYAGSFYDASPDMLRKQFDKWFSQAELPANPDKVYGVICPHAGYIYSGACASYSYKLLSQYNFKTAIIIHPSHRGNHFGSSISPFAEYQTPLGNLHIDTQLAEILSDRGFTAIDSSYHQNEHSMEVQLPFLAYINPDIKVLPIMIGNQNDAVSLQLAEILAEVMRDRQDETVIIVSTDLSHYHSAKEAERMDNKLIEYVLNSNPEELYDNIVRGKIEACGFAGVLSLLYLAKLPPEMKPVKLNYTHSGYASKDFEQVVGYFSAALIS